jgi:transposase
MLEWFFTGLLLPLRCTKHDSAHVALADGLAKVGCQRTRATVLHLSKVVARQLQQGPGSHLAALTQAIQAMRGISEISAVILVSEIGDSRRFAHPRHFVS